MSIHSMNEVWRKSESTGGARLTLLAIADDANDNGVAWPSVGRIAWKSRQSDRNVQLCIAKLVKDGELAIIGKVGEKPYQTNLYQVLIVEPKDPQAVGGSQPPKRPGRPRKNRGENFAPQLPGDGEAGVKPARVGVKSVQEPTGEQGRKVFTRSVTYDPPIDPLRDSAPAAPSTPVPDTAQSAKPAQARVAKVRATPAPTPTRIKESNRYFQRGDVLPEGRWPDKATADNPVKLYYCYWSMSNRDERLTAPQADDLAKMCPDLKRLDDVLLAYSRTPYRARNLNLVFDWYLNGVPGKYRVAAAGHGDNALTNGIVAKGNHREEPQADTTGQPADSAAADFWRNYYAQQGAAA